MQSVNGIYFVSVTDTRQLKKKTYNSNSFCVSSNDRSEQSVSRDQHNQNCHSKKSGF